LGIGVDALRPRRRRCVRAVVPCDPPRHHIDADRRGLWSIRLDAAEASQPSDFTSNGWVVEALQGAWSAITTTSVPQDDPAKGVFRVDHLRRALDAAVRDGGDTDTVAAIAGGLLGAVYGASAVPAQWRRVLHGWPGLATRELVALATRIVKADKPFSYDIDPMTPARHPHDGGVIVTAGPMAHVTDTHACRGSRVQ
jgi:ADP-ribosyl-[dinitrogen reductase] hydrolase